MTHTPTPLDHLLALALAIFFPIRSATFGYRRLAETGEADVTRVRRQLYLQSIAIEWGLVAIVVGLWLATGRPWQALGLVWRPNPWAIGLTAGCLIGVAVVAMRLPQLLADPAVLGRVRQKLKHIARLFPVSPDDARRFAALAITAGVCEELLYRGFLLDYLRHVVSGPLAVVLAVLAFAIGHSYQGPRGILTTGIAGAVFMAMTLATGSIHLAMLIHALLDLYSGTLARRAFAAPSAPPAAAAVPVSGVG